MTSREANWSLKRVGFANGDFTFVEKKRKNVIGCTLWVAVCKARLFFHAIRRPSEVRFRSHRVLRTGGVISSKRIYAYMMGFLFWFCFVLSIGYKTNGMNALFYRYVPFWLKPRLVLFAEEGGSLLYIEKERDSLALHRRVCLLSAQRGERLIFLAEETVYLV